MVRASARALLAACLSFLLLPGVRGEPIPDTPALQRPVTLRGERRTLGETLAELSKLSGVPLSVDEHCESAALAAGAADCPLRDLMTALAAASRLEWRAEADGSYRLRGPAFLPPLMDTAALLRLLSDACPPWARPAPDSGPPPAVSRSALMEQVYALLRRSARDRVDEGGEVPFADFPLIARQALMEHWRGMIRSDAAESLAPRWCVPADRLALRFHDPAQGIVVWGVAVRQDPPAPPTGAAARPGSRAEPEWLGVGANIGYQPGAVRWKPPPEPERGVLLSEAALAFAERARIGVVIADGGGLPAGEPKGATVSEGLAALLPEGERSRYRWESDGRACWLTRREAPAAAIAAEVTQRRQALLAALPPEYGEFLALPPSLAWSALGAAWVTLWHSFSPAERRPGRVVTAAQLSPEQRRQLIAALQGAAVHAIWMLLERALSDPTREAVLCLNFGPPSLSQMQVLGTPRVLQMHVGGALAFSSGVAGPPLLPYLPAGDPVLQKPASLDLEETPLAEAADRIAKLLGAPVVAQEPAEAMTLTASFRDAPLRRVLHWVERHTNLRWRRRAGIYVLAPPVPVARLAADPKAALSLLTRGIPSYPPISPREMTLAITEQDRRALESGLVPLSQLSPGLEDAIRGRLYSDAERMASSIRTSLELLGRLNEARLRLEPMLPARGRDPDALLYVELSEDVKAGFVIPSESRPNQ